jgi:hypothetical protein
MNYISTDWFNTILFILFLWMVSYESKMINCSYVKRFPKVLYIKFKIGKLDKNQIKHLSYLDRRLAGVETEREKKICFISLL